LSKEHWQWRVIIEASALLNALVAAENEPDTSVKISAIRTSLFDGSLLGGIGS
ncbi:hypothetical protein HPB47_028407, partial [Ixodes persulcatus]